MSGLAPGDTVRVFIHKYDPCHETYNGQRGVVAYGPDCGGGWMVRTPVGTHRCVADEMVMVMGREHRCRLRRGLRAINAWRNAWMGWRA